MPVIYSAILAAGVMLGIYIAKSNGIVATEKSGDNSLFINEVFSLINEEYVDTVNMNDLQMRAINNVLESMDPHSEYIKPEILNEVNENLQGSFHGIGVSFRIEKGLVSERHTCNRYCCS